MVFDHISRDFPTEIATLHAHKKEQLRIGIVAGEASGDLLGAELIQALQLQVPKLVIEGIGGPALQKVGCKSLFNMERLSVMGFIDPLLRLPELYKMRKNLLQHFLSTKPDFFIGIDAPDFNLGLEFKLRQAGIPVIHYISPSVWAWRQYRIHKIKKSVDLMLTLLPFEKDFYQKHQMPVSYVGHPLADRIPMEENQSEARYALDLENNRRYIALLPGSRKREVGFLAEPFLKAAKLLYQKNNQLRFITAQVNEARLHEFYAAHKRICPELPLRFFLRRTHDVLAAADCVVVTSGTATLEAMLFKKPMVIAYRMSSLTFALGKCLVKTPFIGLPNLLANELVVPELIQHAVTPTAIADHVLNFLHDESLVTQLKHKFLTLHHALKMPAASLAANAILSSPALSRSAHANLCL